MDRPLGSSVTTENYCDSQSKAVGTPSMVSSGYGSQAVSSTTLSSDDSMSIRSISVDETPDSEAKAFKDVQGDRGLVSQVVAEDAKVGHAIEQQLSERP